MTKEGMMSLHRTKLCIERPYFLPCDSELRQQTPRNIVGDLASPEHLPRQPRRSRGVGHAHDVHVGRGSVGWKSRQIPQDL